ncbi:hypothetical protein JXB31_02070 [Candidatus Woesearchaeota archaeon]|nr:hypothetical protein [Candidatus Woesearchaeota archaeon]
MSRTMLFVFMLLVLSFSVCASDDFYVFIHYDEAATVDEPLDLFYNVRNVADRRIDDISFKAYIPELDVYTVSGQFDLGKGEVHSGYLFMDLPDYVEAGEYLVRFVSSNDCERHVRHRYIYIE